ncbi:MAG: PDZ domain-containing protein [Desulfobulbaceae bacterium]|nr:PDZ domain-containing protein [Desulfobulbaceae bacterium]
MKTSLLYLLLSLLVLSLFLINYDLDQRPETTEPDYPEPKEDKVILLFAEAVSVINNIALFIGPKDTREKIANESLKKYLNSRDPYSDYLTKNEYQKFQQLQNESYVGIGMDLKKDRSGGLHCFPYPGSPAEEAGIKIGDRLINMNGMNVNGKSLPSLAALSVGKAGTTFQVTVSTNNDPERQLQVVRAKLLVKNVVITWLGDLPVVKMSDFRQDTKRELQQAVNEIPPKKPVILDLRGNSGGDLIAAISSAMLFLEKGERIVSINTRKGEKIISSSTDTVNVPTPIYLWQDESTASAAEIFIAALTENNKAISVGHRTFGKGTQQDFIPLSDGSALVLTTGKLLTPKGLDFQDLGLNPTHGLVEKASSTEDYLLITKKLLDH